MGGKKKIFLALHFKILSSMYFFLFKFAAGYWSCSFNEDSKEHELLRSEENLEVLITPCQFEICKWSWSEGARKAIKLFGDFATEPLSELS